MIYVSFRCLGAALRVEGLSPRLASLARAVWVSLIGYLCATMFISAYESELLYILMGLSTAIWLVAQRETGAFLHLPQTLTEYRMIAMIEIVGVIGLYLLTNSFWANM